MAPASAPPSRKSPRRTTKTKIPPAAAPPRRETMEVQPSWLEPDAEGATPAPPPLVGGGARHQTLEVRADWLLDDARPDVDGSQEPQEGTHAPPSGSGPASRSSRPVSTRSTRRAWEPPSLPPPPDTAVRSRRGLSPPIPREDEASPPSASQESVPSKKKRPLPR